MRELLYGFVLAKIIVLYSFVIILYFSVASAQQDLCVVAFGGEME